MLRNKVLRNFVIILELLSKFSHIFILFILLIACYRLYIKDRGTLVVVHSEVAVDGQQFLVEFQKSMLYDGIVWIAFSSDYFLNSAILSRCTSGVNHNMIEGFQEAILAYLKAGNNIILHYKSNDQLRYDDFIETITCHRVPFYCIQLKRSGKMHNKLAKREDVNSSILAYNVDFYSILDIVIELKNKLCKK